MLEEIAQDSFASVPATSNEPMFRLDIDYDTLLRTRDEALSRWRNLTPVERASFSGESDYLQHQGVRDLKSPELVPAKNMALLLNEIKERGVSFDVLKLLALDILDVDSSLLELAESLENVSEIRALYRLRKITTGRAKNSGINVEEAARVKNCYTQGRELYLAGQQGSLMVKPLNFFYALTAYSYGIIILNNPLRYRKGGIPGSHGMSYQPETIQAQFGGDSAKGTFSDLVTAFPTHLVKTPTLEINIDCSASIIRFYEMKFTVSLGTLLSMVPEMAEYYKLTTGRNSRCHPLEVRPVTGSHSLTWEFRIGDGEVRPSNDSLDQSFGSSDRAERLGQAVVTIPAGEASSIKACIYTDIRGKLWFVENPFFPIMLPEVALHFLITSMFSNIMRYRPDEWGSVLMNDVPSQISLLTRHYFSSFQRKFFLVVLRALSRYLPYAS